MMFRLSPVVKNLIILNLIVFLGRNLLQIFPFEMALHPIGSPSFRPYQIISNLFSHGYMTHPMGYQVKHLIYNMLGLFIFGGMLEDRIGSKSFGIIYLTSAIGGLVLHQIVGLNTDTYIVVVGASGAIMGITAAVATHSPDSTIQLLFIPFPIKLKWIAIFYIFMDVKSIFSNANDGTAHWVHLGGAITGFLVMKLWYLRK